MQTEQISVALVDGVVLISPKPFCDNSAYESIKSVQAPPIPTKHHSILCLTLLRDCHTICVQTLPASMFRSIKPTTDFVVEVLEHVFTALNPCVSRKLSTVPSACFCVLGKGSGDIEVIWRENLLIWAFNLSVPFDELVFTLRPAFLEITDQARGRVSQHNRGKYYD